MNSKCTSTIVHVDASHLLYGNISCIDMLVHILSSLLQSIDLFDLGSMIPDRFLFALIYTCSTQLRQLTHSVESRERKSLGGCFWSSAGWSDPFYPRFIRHLFSYERRSIIVILCCKIGTSTDHLYEIYLKILLSLDFHHHM